MKNASAQRRLTCWCVGLCLAVAAGVDRSVIAAEQPAEPMLSFNRDIAPLVFAHCAACHRPGEVAPFSLLTFEDVSKRADQVADVLRRRVMPPWKPVTGHGEFANGRRLTEDEIQRVTSWAKQGALEGDAADLPDAPVFAEGWQLGAPDLVLTMSEPFVVPSEGPDVYRNVVLPFAIPPGKFLKAVEYRPSNRRVVHHAVVGYDTSGQARRLEAEGAGVGFAAIVPPGWNLPGTLAIWTPGRTPMPLAEGLSMPWPSNADLVLNVHLHPSGKPEVEQSSVGFYFTDQPPQQSMIEIGLADASIDIPAGAKDYRTQASQVLPFDMDALQVFPHMHLLGKEMRVTAKLPSGVVLPLLWIDDWDADWQGVYEFSRPIRLPRGTTLTMSALHDNSADNPRNPNSPPVRVRYGAQTENEMSVAFINLVPVREGDVTAQRLRSAPRMHLTILTEATLAALSGPPRPAAAPGPRVGAARSSLQHVAPRPAVDADEQKTAAAADSPKSGLGRVEQFNLDDVQGQNHSRAEWSDARAVVLLFLGTECPVANGYAPEMARLEKKYAAAGVRFYGVHCDRDVTATIAARHAAEYALTFNVLLDHDQRLASQAGATITPQAIILLPDGEVVYRGRIDNRYTPEGKRRAVATVPELAAAIDAVLAGHRPVEAENKAYGCPIQKLTTAPSDAGSR